MMAGQGQFQATAQGGAVDCRHHRLAQGFQLTQRPGDLGAEHGEKLFGVLWLHLDQLAEVAAGKKRFLGRGQNNAFDTVNFSLQALDGLAKRLAKIRIHGVGGLVGHIQGKGDNVVLVFFVANRAHEYSRFMSWPEGVLTSGLIGLRPV